MSLITSEQARVLDLRDLSLDGHDGPIPAEVAEFPAFKKLAAIFLDLQARFDTERRAIIALVGELDAAHRADRHALAVATAAGEDDPGSAAIEALVEKVTAARRRVVGTGDALDLAYRELLDALIEHREAFTGTLDLDQADRRARAVELIAELADNVAAAGKPAAALRWMARATDPQKVWRGLPSVHVPDPEVFVEGRSLQLAHVLHGLREVA